MLRSSLPVSRWTTRTRRLTTSRKIRTRRRCCSMGTQAPFSMSASWTTRGEEEEEEGERSFLADSTCSFSAKLYCKGLRCIATADKNA